MSDLRELYQEIILDHNKNPRNFRVIEDSDHMAEGFNPLCGDRLTVYLSVKGDFVEDISFEGSGCAISTASASLMTEIVKGRSVEEVRALFEEFHKLVTGRGGQTRSLPGAEKLVVFHGVSEYPVRVKCATLPWHTLLAAFSDKEEPVSTE